MQRQEEFQSVTVQRLGKSGKMGNPRSGAVNAPFCVLPKSYTLRNANSERVPMKVSMPSRSKRESAMMCNHSFRC